MAKRIGDTNEFIERQRFINDSEGYKNNPSMNTDSDGKLSKTSDQVDDTAQHIQDKLGGDSKWWKFYCKVAWCLDRATIDRLITTANENGNDPGGLFHYLVREEMNKRGCSNGKHD